MSRFRSLDELQNNPDFAALWAGVLSSPKSDIGKLATADWLDEHNKPELAHAIRWCVSRKKWPKKKGKNAVEWADGWNGKKGSYECVLERAASL